MKKPVLTPFAPKGQTSRPHHVSVIKTGNRTINPDLIKASERVKKSLSDPQNDTKVMSW